MNVRLSPVLLLRVPMWDVHVFQGRMVVFVRVGGEEVSPIFSTVQVVRDVIVLVTMLQGFVLVMSLLPRHPQMLPSAPGPARTLAFMRRGLRTKDHRDGEDQARRPPPLTALDHLDRLTPSLRS